MPAEQLPGGAVAEVIRIGDTVRRTLPRDAEFVHALLAEFARLGWPGAPRYHGIDEQGRQTLSYIDGHVAWAAEQLAGVSSDASLVRVAKLVRQFHDLTAGSELADGQEVVCHNDLSPRNTVYRDEGAGLQPVAFIDWDIAAPGARLHDLAHACWQYLDLGPGIPSVAEASRRMRVICDGYGLDDRSELVDTILWWQDRCWTGILNQAEAGVAAMIRLRDSGEADAVREAYRWVAAHRSGLSQHLR
jgi:aminoglycoside phosphotransferase (APT) family kinase protein